VRRSTTSNRLQSRRASDRSDSGACGTLGGLGAGRFLEVAPVSQVFSGTHAFFFVFLGADAERNLAAVRSGQEGFERYLDRELELRWRPSQAEGRGSDDR